MSKRLITTKNGKTERTLREQTCAIQDICGKCAIIELPYKEQLSQKVKTIKEKILTLEPNFQNVSIKDCVPAPARLGYRNFVHLMISDYKPHSSDGDASKRRINIGFYQPRLKRVVDIGRCPVLNISLNHVLAWLRTGIRIHNVSVYHSAKKFGLVKGIVLSISGEQTSQISICFVVTKMQSAELRPLVCDIIAKFTNIRSITMKLEEDTENKNIKILSGRASSLEDIHPNVTGMAKLLAYIDDLKKQYDAYDDFALISKNEYISGLKPCVSLEEIIVQKPRIVCFVSALAQNTKPILTTLFEHGYTGLFIEPFDILPGTDYCETVFLFERKNK